MFQVIVLETLEALWSSIFLLGIPGEFIATVSFGKGKISKNASNPINVISRRQSSRASLLFSVTPELRSPYAARRLCPQIRYRVLVSAFFRLEMLRALFDKSIDRSLIPTVIPRHTLPYCFLPFINLQLFGFRSCHRVTLDPKQLG